MKENSEIRLSSFFYWLVACVGFILYEGKLSTKSSRDPV